MASSPSIGTRASATPVFKLVKKGSDEILITNEVDTGAYPTPTQVVPVIAAHDDGDCSLLQDCTKQGNFSLRLSPFFLPHSPCSLNLPCALDLALPSSPQRETLSLMTSRGPRAKLSSV